MEWLILYLLNNKENEEDDNHSYIDDYPDIPNWGWYILYGILFLLLTLEILILFFI